jgi:hypothetical protein
MSKFLVCGREREPVPNKRPAPGFFRGESRSFSPFFNPINFFHVENNLPGGGPPENNELKNSVIFSCLLGCFQLDFKVKLLN